MSELYYSKHNRQSSLNRTLAIIGLGAASFLGIGCGSSSRAQETNRPTADSTTTTIEAVDNTEITTSSTEITTEPTETTQATITTDPGESSTTSTTEMVDVTAEKSLHELTDDELKAMLSPLNEDLPEGVPDHARGYVRDLGEEDCFDEKVHIGLDNAGDVFVQFEDKWMSNLTEIYGIKADETEILRSRVAEINGQEYENFTIEGFRQDALYAFCNPDEYTGDGEYYE